MSFAGCGRATSPVPIIGYPKKQGGLGPSCPLRASYGIMHLLLEAWWPHCLNMWVRCTSISGPTEGIRLPCTCGGRKPDARSGRAPIRGMTWWVREKLRTRPLRISKKNGRAKGWLRTCIQARPGRVGLSRNALLHRNPPLLRNLQLRRLLPGPQVCLCRPQLQRLPRNRLLRLLHLLRQSPRQPQLPPPRPRPSPSVSFDQFGVRSSRSVVRYSIAA